MGVIKHEPWRRVLILFMDIPIALIQPNRSLCIQYTTTARVIVAVAVAVAVAITTTAAASVVVVVVVEAIFQVDCKRLVDGRLGRGIKSPVNVKSSSQHQANCQNGNGDTDDQNLIHRRG